MRRWMSLPKLATITKWKSYPRVRTRSWRFGQPLSRVPWTYIHAPTKTALGRKSSSSPGLPAPISFRAWRRPRRELSSWHGNRRDGRAATSRSCGWKTANGHRKRRSPSTRPATGNRRSPSIPAMKPQSPGTATATATTTYSSGAGRMASSARWNASRTVRTSKRTQASRTTTGTACGWHSTTAARVGARTSTGSTGSCGTRAASTSNGKSNCESWSAAAWCNPHAPWTRDSRPVPSWAAA